jgi:hypothetical protein
LMSIYPWILLTTIMKNCLVNWTHQERTVMIYLGSMIIHWPFSVQVLNAYTKILQSITSKFTSSQQWIYTCVTEEHNCQCRLCDWKWQNWKRPWVSNVIWWTGENSGRF